MSEFLKKEQYSVLLEQLLDQLAKYSNVSRKSTQPFTLKRLREKYPNDSFDFDDLAIRETLIEHVGCLPIIAAFLHPYLDIEVDLGKVLIMLSVHDIGETELGDELTFTKTSNQDQTEFEKGLQLLHPNYHSIYKEESDLQTTESKFAKSIDKIAPDILDFLSGEEYTINRLSVQAGWDKSEVIQKIRDKKRLFMLWSEFMTGFHDELFSRFSTKTNP
jgi:5'-deoxynucleotidase YfbR-like HD superfamily hydrolase